MRRLALIMLAAAASVSGGCESNAPFMTHDRLQSGLVIILPGIEGESNTSREIRKALDHGGLNRSLQIWHWGRPVPILGLLLNQVDFLGNYIAAQRVIDRIIEYQDEYPGRPVHIVGQSGGGGIAVFAAQALPKGRKIDGIILLSASISSAYNIEKALNHCRSGIANFYNPDDVMLLAAATTIVGNVDGIHGPSAGLIGFDRPGKSASRARKRAYGRLYQIPLANLESDSNGLAHLSTGRYRFILNYVTPWLFVTSWPPYH